MSNSRSSPPPSKRKNEKKANQIHSHEIAITVHDKTASFVESFVFSHRVLLNSYNSDMHRSEFIPARTK